MLSQHHQHGHHANLYESILLAEGGLGGMGGGMGPAGVGGGGSMMGGGAGGGGGGGGKGGGYAMGGMGGLGGAGGGAGAGGSGRREEKGGGHVVEFSADQHGSRFIQQKLEMATDAEKELVFCEVLPRALSLMTDVFGNYVIQKFFEHGLDSHRAALAAELKGHVLALGLQMYGCRVIQKALEVLPLPQQLEIIAELEGSVMRCVRDQNGNHVIQKCIECVPPAHIASIVNSFYGQVVALSTHPYGCRVIQRVLEHCTEEQKQRGVMDEIMRSTCSLAQDQYGNYVVQHVLEHGSEDERNVIITKLAGQIVTMSQHKFASNVIEKCLQYGGPAQKQLLLSEMLGRTDENEPLQAMMKDQFGNYVVQKVLETCSEQQREMVLGRIRVHLHTLKKFTYGKHIVARVEKLLAAGGRMQSRAERERVMAPSYVGPPGGGFTGAGFSGGGNVAGMGSRSGGSTSSGAGGAAGQAGGMMNSLPEEPLPKLGGSRQGTRERLFDRDDQSLKYKGVQKHVRGWLVKYASRGKTVVLGVRPTQEEAASLYDKFAYKVHGNAETLNLGLTLAEKRALDALSDREFLAIIKKDNFNLSFRKGWSSNYIGVSWYEDYGGWVAQVNMGGITRKIKRSKTEEVAAAAVDRALLRRDGDRAITNAMIFGGCIKVETLMDLEGLRDAVILSRVAEMEGGASAKSVSIVPATQLPSGSELVAGWAGKLRWGVMHNKDKGVWEMVLYIGPKPFLRGRTQLGDEAARLYDRMAYKFRGTTAVLNFGLSAAEKLELEQMTKDDFHLHLRKRFVRSFRSRSCPSIYKGVKWGPQEQKWIAAIRVGNRFSKIGLYDAEEEAAAAYDRTIVEVRGVHVMTNAKFVDGLNHAQVTVTEIPIKGQEEAFIRAAGGGVGGEGRRGGGRGGHRRGRGRGRPPITHLAREERRNRLVASLGGSAEAAKLGITGGDGAGAAGDGAGAAAELGAGAAEGEGGGGEGEGEGEGGAVGDGSGGGGKEEWVPPQRAEELEQIEEWMANEWEQGEIVGWMDGVAPGGEERGLSTLAPAGAAAGGDAGGAGEGGAKEKGDGEEEGSLAIDLEMAGLDDGDDAAGGGEGGGDADGDWEEFCETTAREVAEGAGAGGAEDGGDGTGAGGSGGAGKKGAGGKGGEVGADELGNAHASVEQLLAAAEAGPGGGAGAAGGGAGGRGRGRGTERKRRMMGEGGGDAHGRDWMDTVEGDDDKTDGEGGGEGRGGGEGGGGDGSKTPAKGPGQEGDAGAITPAQDPSRLPLTPGSAPSTLQISTISTLAAPTSSSGGPDSSGLQAYSGKRPRGRPRIHEHPEEEKNRLSEKYMGVEFKGRTRAWEAFLMSGQRRYNYGQRYTEEEAARLHDKVAYRLKGPTAPTNFDLSEEDKARLDSMTVEEFLTHVRRTNVSSVFQGRRGSSLFKGVSWMPDKQRWAALIKLDHGKVRKIGLYTTEEDAAAAYDRALIDRDGPEALTNERFFRSLDDDALDRLLQSRRSRDESCNWKERAKYFLDNIDKLGHKSKRARAPSPVGARGLVGGGGGGPVGSREGEEGPQAGTAAALGGGAISSQKVSQSAAGGRKGRGGGAAGSGRYGGGGMGSGGYGYMGGGVMGGGGGVMGMGGSLGFVPFPYGCYRASSPKPEGHAGF
ncbi:unnamed protein product [Closterium sp. Yama58-4]|nr:unnamed protein product [Closterium sp. Yama58-4]